MIFRQGVSRMKYYTKLLTLETDGCFIILYGFSGQTEQSCYSWKTIKIDKKIPLVCFHTIWSDTQASSFEKNIQSESPYEIRDGVLVSSGLTPRPQALSNHILEEHSEWRPISGFYLVSEFWNTDKGQLFQIVERTLGGEGKALFEKTCNLFSLMLRECGVDFSREGWRFGNFEVYRKPKYQNGFKITVLKRNALQTTVVEKCIPIEESLVIRCAAEHRCRWHTDTVKLLETDEDSTSFHAEEPMSRVRVQVWKVGTGELVFSFEQVLMMSINASMGLSDPTFVVSDTWTKKLHQSSPGQKEKIDQIETVNRVLKDRSITIISETYTKIDTALEEGNRLLAPFNREKTKGAFIPKIGKDGEMDSFLKIKDYLSNSDIKKAVLADPFFSVRAAEKLLCRIPTKNLQLEIITSLIETNPDTAEKEDAAEFCRRVLYQNSGNLHPNLIVKNLTRGNEQVFHDRYLIRYYTDGRIDGFLLSNSLNSAGQFFPFVIAPLEKEVCMNVCEYLENLTNPAMQNALPKREQVSCEILYDNTSKDVSKEIAKDSRQSVLFNLIKGSCCSGLTFSPKLIDAIQTTHDSFKVRFDKSDLPQVISAILSCWSVESLRAVKAIGEAMGHSYCWTTADFIRELKKTEVYDQKLAAQITTLARSVEAKQNHARFGIESPVYKYWVLLKGSAQINKHGLNLLIEDPDHIFYSRDYYLHGCYQLLLLQSPEQFVNLMKETASPLMLNILTVYMAIGNWFPELYSALLASEIAWIPALAADWLCSHYQREARENEWIISILGKVPFEKQLLQYLYILSQLTFWIRVPKRSDTRLDDYKGLREVIIQEAANTLDKYVTERMDDNRDFNWLFDSEDASHCELYLDLALKVTVEPQRNWLLEYAINFSWNKLKERYIGNNGKHLIQCLALTIYLRHGKEGGDFIVSQVFQQRYFNLFTEPYRQDYDYWNWSRAKKQAEWQITLMKEYLQIDPTAQNVNKQYEYWKTRFKMKIARQNKNLMIEGTY